jgi:hypothetical protein
MPINKIFWFVSFTTVVFLGLQIAGYAVTPALIALLIIDVVVLKVSMESKHHKLGMNVMYDLNSKLGSIHTCLLDIGNFLSATKMKGDVTPNAGMVTLGAIENSLGKHSEVIRGEFKNEMDKVATKVIDVENRITDMRKGFSAAIAAFDDRMRCLEEGDFVAATTKDDPDYVEL